MTKQYMPSGSMCVECTRRHENCGDLPFDTMRVIEKMDNLCVVKCTGYKKGNPNVISEIDIQDMKPESLDAAYERKAINEGWEFTPAFKENVHQIRPIANNLVPVWNLVMADMVERNATGIAKYGMPLQPFNGRDVLLDAYEEALDLTVYLRSALYEKDGK